MVASIDSRTGSLFSCFWQQNKNQGRICCVNQNHQNQCLSFFLRDLLSAFLVESYKMLPKPPQFSPKTMGETSSGSSTENADSTKAPEDMFLRVLTSVQRGRFENGRVVQPNAWAGALVLAKPEMQVKMENFIESCSFKTGMSGVMGRWRIVKYFPLIVICFPFISSWCRQYFPILN